ncbi:MAG: TetR family transcriptional regulator [Solirubrobacterales bacterium]|nr:TetR family transcriptional regulator [Solirubrobacterales bacterium]
MFTVPANTLRERKKAKTREKIVSVALRLFADDGYANTTIARIAEEAEVSPRTVATYFPAKEDIVFYLSDMTKQRLVLAIEERDTGVDTMTALRKWLLEERELFEQHHELMGCQQKVIDNEAALRAHEQAVMRDFELVLADGLALDLGMGSTDLEPRLAAAATMAVFDLLGDERKGRAEGELPPLDEQLEKLDQALTFITGGVAALRDARD